MAVCYEAKERKKRCAITGTEKPEPYSLEYGEDISGPRTREMPAIVRLSRKVSVGHASTAGCVPAHSSPEEDANVEHLYGHE